MSIVVTWQVPEVTARVLTAEFKEAATAELPPRPELLRYAKRCQNAIVTREPSPRLADGASPAEVLAVTTSDAVLELEMRTAAAMLLNRWRSA